MEIYLYNNEWYDSFSSSNILRFRYEYWTHSLYVQFARSLKTYVYQKVPEQVMLDWMAAGSKGVFHHQHIKGKYDFDGPFG